MKKIIAVLTVMVVITLLFANILQLSSKASGLDDLDEMGAYNCTGDVQYYYGGSVAVTHYENF